MNNYNDYNVIIYLDKTIDYIPLERTTEKMAISVANEVFNSRTNVDKVMVIDKDYKVIYTKELYNEREVTILWWQEKKYIYMIC